MMRAPYFQAVDVILLMVRKNKEYTRILEFHILRDTSKEKGERSVLTPLSDYRLISGVQLRLDISI